MKNRDKFYKKILKNFDILSNDEIKRVFTQLNSLYNTQLMVAENLEEGVVALNNNDEVLFSNKKAMFFLDINIDMVGKRLYECIKKNSFAYSIIEIIAHGNGAENNILHDKNNSRMLRINVLPLGHEGRIEGMLILIFDVTNIWLQSQKLKRAEQLASLTTVAASVAHEIKNPLGSISIYIQLIEKTLRKIDVVEDSSCELIDYCRIVKEEITRLEDTVNSFLFSVKTINLDLEKHNTATIITDTIKFLQHEIKDANIQIEINSKQDDIIALLDIKYIKQALINIVQNSIDALKNIDNVLDKKIVIDIDCDSSDIFITISDSGEGIADEDIAKVFEPYYTTKDLGTGLGLTNVARIIEAHNGNIEISSEKNIGTCIEIKLPIINTEKRLTTTL